MQTKNRKRAVGLLSASALILGMIAAQQDATAGIANTRHNLGSSNRNGSGKTVPTVPGNAMDGDIHTTSTDEICVFCHTPHGGENSVAPLWNKGITGLLNNYTVYSSGTMQGTASLGLTNMSLACLSCHDGTQAMDNMINQPGSNGYTQAGASLANVNPNNGWPTGDTNGGIMNGVHGNQQGADLSNTGVGLFMLGTDLRNDHPVGIPFCGGNSNGTCMDPDFWTPNGTNAGQAPGFYVSGSTASSAAITRQNIRVYPANGNYGETDPFNSTVECGSCHDPHNEQEKTFLRISNAGSAVCLTCHNK